MDISNRFCVSVEGVVIPRFLSEECFRSALRFKPKRGDVFVATYPKCGTTWMQNLVLNIMRRGRNFEKPSDFHFASPFLDMLGAEDSEKIMIRPGCYKTHLPLHKVPWSDDAKYIYVARNPKDCCVSLYHHMKNLPGYQFSDGPFEEFFDLFIKGEVEFGNYFDHLIPWYEARHRSNVFFTTFEEMKMDLKKIAMKLAEFIDKTEAEYLQDNPEVLESILHNCTFAEMKKIMNEGISVMYSKDHLASLPKGRRHIIQYIESFPKRIETDRKINVIRKGEIGSHKHELTPKQNEILSRIIQESTKGTDVMSLWEKWM
ncbi:sulfotransferase ssu-1-like [Argiope bruennichi]|uniref:sulfotransferase ssu-1-like n=1 Tax=Argiope bruennichi TaxID=94029 RepID=UPI00249562F4|nr:sulfotransferase ssu-1-like [Argiope bruennichi]